MLDSDGTSALDQATPKPLVIVEGKRQDKYEEDYVLELSDRVLGQSLEDGSFEMAFLAIGKFRAMNKASSLGVCKLLHGVKANWDKVEHKDGETFESEAVRVTGYSAETVERYVNIWELLTGEYVPEEFRENIHHQTIRQLVKVAETVVDQGYELEHDDWLALSDAVDYHATMDVCQKAKGKERNKNHMSLKLYDDGRLVVFQGNKEEHFGMLFVDKDVELVQKAIRRVTKDSGISRENEY